jgi:dihydroorotate dehydrogenase electron transfer subunit
METASATTLPITKVVTENTRVKSFWFRHRLEAIPGQYLLVGIPGHGERAFGAVVVDEDTFLISVGAAGEGTRSLHEMKEGDTVSVRGPFGTGFTLPATPGRVALVAGGYGMAPLGYLARRAVEGGHTVDLFAGARNEHEFLIYPWFDRPGITLHKTTEDGSAGTKGFVTDAFTVYLEQTRPAMVYTVGPEVMEAKVADACYEKGIPFELSLERLAEDPNGPVIDGERYRNIRAAGA